MELALVGDGAAREQQVRLKLHFEDRSILSAEQLQDGLADSWFLVACHLRSIADLASHIIVAFGLVHSCPHGISLRMENFTLPSSQSVWLLKDKDIVSVHKKYISPAAVVKHVHSSSFDTFDKVAPLGVKTHALEEFERETGGYESEHEEENNSLEARRKDKTSKTSSTKSKQKKRKRENIERADEQGITKLQVVPYTSVVTNEEGKGKKSKKQRLIVREDENKIRDKVKYKKSNKQVLVVQQDDNEKVCQAEETKEFAKDKNVQEPESSDAIKKKKKKKQLAGDVSLEQPTIQKQQASKGSSKNVLSSTSDSSSDENAEDEERKSGLPVAAEKVKKLSRSTLRKKAKRRWRREHGELVKNHSDKLVDDPKKAAAHKDAAGWPSVNFITKQEDDGDAEEERLPRVVRPGHIRFEPLDEDEDDNLRSQHPLPLLAWSNGLSKRKGQSWGQEKAKRGSKYLEVVDNMERCDAQELNYEALPALQGTPQNGDVIAYRILELASSFCPELSEYRVGKVVDLESQSGALKLEEVPKYPLKRRHNAETNKDVQFSSLYDEGGFLETQISSLSDIRLVEGSLQEACKAALAKEELPELIMTENDTDLNTCALDAKLSTATVFTDLARTDTDTNLNTATFDTQVDVDKTCSTDPNTSNTRVLVEDSSPAPFQGPPETRVDVNKMCNTTLDTSNTHIPIEENSPSPFQGWPELFDVIEKKKQELGDKDTATSSGAAELDKPKSENNCSSTANNAIKDARTGRARGWHRKAGGLGATMALLRSQNAQ